MNDDRTTESGPQGLGDNNPVAPPPPPLSPDYGPRPVSRRGKVGGYVALALVLLGGLAAGVLFHEPILHAFGRHQHQAPVAEGGKKQLWTCGMHPQVIRNEPGLCPICHMKLTPIAAGSDPAAAGAGGGERKVKYWWDPMIGPESISDTPGKSAMGMDLVPVYEGEGASDTSGGTAVTIDPVVVQNMGVRVAEATSGQLNRTIRAVGYLEEAQPFVHDVNLRISGWVEKLYADTVGVHLKKGDKLFDLYSPEVQVAIEELIAARRALAALGPKSDALARRTSQTLLDATRRKLEQWGLDPQEVDRLAKLDKAPRTVTFTSPITGHVTEKMVVDGSAVKAGDRAMRIVDHSTLWLDSQVYAQDQPFIKLGQNVTAEVEGVTGKPIEGEVIFVHPHVDPTTRTATVRVAIPNPKMTLRPGMYATAQISDELAESALLVPREAVIDTGTRQVTFVALGGGKFEPRNVKTGAAGADGMVQIVEGIKEGERVVTSGQFLLDAESRMREAIQKHLDERLLAEGGKGAGEKNAVPADVPMSGEMRANAPMPADPATMPDETASGETLPWSLDVDALFVPYLEMAGALGAAKQPEAPLDAEKLVASAEALVNVTPPEGQNHARKVLSAATALKGKSLDEQRKLFAPLSEAVIAMAKVCPPSTSIAEKLFVMHCPMKKATWLQTSEKVANPYYATEMKQCGEVKQTLEAVAAK